MGMSKSLSFFERRTNFRELDLFYSTFICFAVFVAMTFRDLFKSNIIKTLVIAGLIIFYLRMRYRIQT